MMKIYTRLSTVLLWGAVLLLAFVEAISPFEMDWRVVLFMALIGLMLSSKIMLENSSRNVLEDAYGVFTVESSEDGYSYKLVLDASPEELAELDHFSLRVEKD